MQHISEVARILEAALAGNTAKIRDYAELLASKLADEGETRQAHILRSILHDIPQPQITASEWRCCCAWQGGAPYTSQCPIHDDTVDTDNPSWRKWYDKHLEQQKRIKERLGW
jgi:hypothetical protein